MKVGPYKKKWTVKTNINYSTEIKDILTRSLWYFVDILHGICIFILEPIVSDIILYSRMLRHTLTRFSSHLWFSYNHGKWLPPLLIYWYWMYATKQWIPSASQKAAFSKIFYWPRRIKSEILFFQFFISL